MYRIHLYFLIGFLFTLNGEKCDKYEEKVQVCKNRNEVDQTENIEKVSDLNNQGKIADEFLTSFDTIKNAEKRQILTRCLSENPFFRIKHRARRSSILSPLRSRPKPLLFPKLSNIFKRRKLLRKAKRIKKQFPNYNYYTSFQGDFSSEEDDKKKEFPNSNYYTRFQGDFFSEEDDHEPIKLDCFPRLRSRMNKRKNNQERDLLNYGIEYDPYYSSQEPAKVIQKKSTSQKNSDLSTQISKKVVEEHADIESFLYNTSQDSIQRKVSSVDSNPAISDKTADSARKFLDQEGHVIDVMRLIDVLITGVNLGDTEIGDEARDLLITPPEERDEKNNGKNIPQRINTSRNPVPKTDQATEKYEPWDVKSDNHNLGIIDTALQQLTAYYKRLSKVAAEDNQKQNSYDTENEVLDLLSNTYKDVIYSFNDNLRESYFPGSNKREYENNFYDTRSNSGFDYVFTDPEMCMCSACEEPFYNDYSDYGICPKCSFAEDMCLLGDDNEPSDNHNNRRRKRETQQNRESKGRDIILRPEHFFYDANLYHIQDMGVKPRAASYLRDDNKLHNLNIYSNNRFVDLDANCSADIDYKDTECQRLDYHLRTPKGANSLPLRRVKDYLNDGLKIARDMQDRVRSLEADGLQPRPNTPSKLQFLNNKVTDNQVELNKESELTRMGTKIMQERLSEEYGITKSNFPDLLRHQGFRVTSNDICRKRRHDQCSTLGKYRNIDGSCNNENYPTWGQSNTPFFRLLPPRYADGIHSLPVSVTGAELPNPRSLSSELFSRKNRTEQFYTLAVMQWGQILAHDFAFQVMDQTGNTKGGGVECCTPDGDPLPERFQHHSCAPIIIPSTDKFYSKFQQRCMNFVRSMTITNEDCTLGAANQLNGATSFLDLSPLYGNYKDKSDSLRQFVGGRLKIEMRNGRSMMPTTRQKSLFCDVITLSDICYKTGDVRTNQNPQLVVLQTLLLREHNRIAGALSSINPHWNDEKIFQESRRILIAMYQHITYKEWLPIVIGNRYCKDHSLVCSDPGMSYDYDNTVNPSTINSFTAAAFRFLHSIVEGELKLFTPMYDVSDTLRLSNHYFRPQVVEPKNNFEALLRGLIYQPIQRPDSSFNEELTEYLFRSKSEYGLDLEAIDIQRGRDHGIPGYNAYRKICHLGHAADFYDLINEISWNNIEKLRKIYAHVDDIDLLVGASLETRLPGSLLGPTVRCLIGEQFYRSRVGDKYFYDNADFHHSFAPEQFEEIKKASLSRLICDSDAAMFKLQLNSFKVRSQNNPLTFCENLPRINLNMWIEEQTEDEYSN